MCVAEYMRGCADGKSLTLENIGVVWEFALSNPNDDYWLGILKYLVELN